VPIDIVFQEPKALITIGIGQDAGLAEVPDARFMRYMLAGFISTIFMPGIGGLCPRAQAARTKPVTIKNCLPNIRFLLPQAAALNAGKFRERGRRSDS
jgi:hypothetical protein